jgi:hypothetical protein
MPGSSFRSSLKRPQHQRAPRVRGVLPRHDADLVSLAESIDTSTPAGRLFYTMIAAMDSGSAGIFAAWRPCQCAPDRQARAAPPSVTVEQGRLGSGREGGRRSELMYELFHENRRKKTVIRSSTSVAIAPERSHFSIPPSALSGPDHKGIRHGATPINEREEGLEAGLKLVGIRGSIGRFRGSLERVQRHPRRAAREG